VDRKEALTKAPIFAGLKGNVINNLVQSARVRKYMAGDVLVREGEEAVAFFVISEGKAQVVKSAGDKEEVVGELGEGDFFGEMALLDGFPRGATVRATTDCECLVLIRWDFTALLKSNPDIALAILPVLSRRLRECEERLLA
jgi:CRP-like cAMP-binding protein